MQYKRWGSSGRYCKNGLKPKGIKYKFKKRRKKNAYN